MLAIVFALYLWDKVSNAPKDPNKRKKLSRNVFRSSVFEMMMPKCLLSIIKQFCEPLGMVLACSTFVSKLIQTSWLIMCGGIFFLILIFIQVKLRLCPQYFDMLALAL